MNRTKKTASLLLAVALLTGLLQFAFPAYAEAAGDTAAEQQSGYDEYLQQGDMSSLTVGEFVFGSDTIAEASDGVETAGEATGEIDGKTEKRSPVCLFTENESYADWLVTVQKEGFYRVAVEYCGLEGKQTDIELEMSINGKIPFSSAYRFLLPRSYADDGKITQDKMDNDVRPMKKEVFEWSRRSLQDKDGIYSEPYLFYFNAGENRIRLRMVQANVAVSGVILYNDEPLDSYAQYIKDQKANPENTDKVAADAFIPIEGEAPYRVTHTMLTATYDRMSAITSPNSAAKLRLNTIGQSNWKMPGQAITWEFHVGEPGYYTIGMRARQNQVRGFFSSRNVFIDGKMLFQEMRDVQVDYSTDWQIVMLGGDEPYQVYLDAGDHTITMEVVGGVVGTSVKKFEDIILELNELYRSMIMVTGTTPDSYRDYKLEKEIPGLQEKMKELAGRIRAVKAEMEAYHIQRGSDAVTAERVAQQLDSFIKKPRTVPERLSSFQGNISSLSGWVLSLKEQPLEIDYLFVQSPQRNLPVAEAGFFQQLGFRWSSFISSFVEDYSMISDETYGGEALNVWIGLGRDQAQIVKDLVENYFTPRYNIKVNLSLVQQGLVEAIAAGKGPDIMLYCGSGDPVNLAARNQLVDLSGLDGFDEVRQRYSKNAFRPYEYNGGVYALPLQQSFSMLFCRTDILADIGVEVPETWPEFYEVMMKIQKKKLQVGIPVGKVTAPDNSMFDTLLYQNGGSYYNGDESATAFDSEAALTAFKQWTEFYTKYGLPVEFDFYVRFRSGEMPMAIQGYTMYNQLTVAAPEIRGLWSMTPIPGTVGEDGKINNTVASGGTGCLMHKKIANKEDGFTFLKWFTSAEIQTEYGLAVENILGQGGRYDPANLEAFGNMNWSLEQQRLLLKQFDNTMITPVIPATYYVTRNVTNAFRGVVVKGLNPRETLYTYNRDINAEITRKRAELGLD